MDFFTLSLPEAVFLYMGLAVQSLVRQMPLAQTVARIVTIWIAVLTWRAVRSRTDYWAPLSYFVACLLLMLFFWPEYLPFGRTVTVNADASRVRSYAASEDGEAQIVSAADTGQVPQTLRAPVFVPVGMRFLLRVTTELPLALARLINSESHRTFSSLMPMHWLLGTDLTTDVTTAVGDWVHNCYLPVLTTTMAGAQGRTLEELLPWDAAPLRRELALRQVIPGAHTGITWIRSATGSPSMPCDVYLDGVEFRTQTWLSEMRSPRGTPLTEVFQQELGLDVERQARFLIYREILRAAGPAVPAPSLTATYAALRGVGLAGQAAGGAASGGVLGWLSGAGKGLSLLVGGVKGGSDALGNEFMRVIDGLSWLVGLAVFFTWWAPYIVGLINLVLLSLGPFVVLWSLVPGNQFQPMAYYVAALFFTNSSPLWWALADQAAKLATGTAPQADDLLLGLGNGAVAYGWSTIVMVLAVLIIPTVCAVVFFGVFRSLGGLLHKPA